MGVVLFVLILLGASFLPGAAAVCFVGIWRRLSWMDRFLYSLPTGLLLLPAVLYITGHVMPISSAGICFSSALLSAILLVAGRVWRLPASLSDPNPKLPRSVPYFWLGVFVFLSLAVFAQFFETESAPRLFPIIYDYPKHQGILFALAGQRLPPANPFFHPGQDIPLSYYYLFHTVPASLTSDTLLSPAHAFAISALLVGLGFLMAVFQLIRRLQPGIGHAIVGVLFLLLLGGLDPIVFYRIFPSLLDQCSGSLFKCWWEIGFSLDGEIPGFLHSMTWAPHHLLSSSAPFLVPTLLSFRDVRKRVFCLLPLIVLTVAGSSVYVAALAVFALVVFGVTRIVRSYGRPMSMDWRFFGGIVVFTCLLLVFFFGEIAPSGETATSGFSLGRPVFSVYGRSTNLWEKLFGGFEFFLRVFISFLPYLLVVCAAPRRRWYPLLGTWEKSLFFVALLTSFFVQSTGHHNDYGSRTLFILRTFLAVAAALSWRDFLGKITKRGVALIGVFLFFYFLSTLNLIYRWGPYRIPQQLHPSRGTADYVDACGWLRKNTEEDSIVQAPLRSFSHLLFLSGRRSAVLDETHGALLNVSPSLYEKTTLTVGRIFANLERSEGADAADALGIRFLLARQHRVPDKLSSRFRVVFENTSFKILRIVPIESPSRSLDHR